VFPLLLILVTILVNIAAGDPSLRNQVIRGATTRSRWSASNWPATSTG
jgi:hypothetical protein